MTTPKEQIGRIQAALPELPEPLEIVWPSLHSQALGCGVEDRGIRDRYEAAEYGWQDGVDRAAECVPEQIFDADQMQAYAKAHAASLEDEVKALREHLQFVERWANHHGAKPHMNAPEALSVIQHYPPILKITHSYADGKVPETPNPWAALAELHAAMDAPDPFAHQGQEAQTAWSTRRANAMDAAAALSKPQGVTS